MFLNRLVVISNFLQRYSQIVMYQCDVGIQFNRPSIRFNRLRPLACGANQFSHDVVDWNGKGIHFETLSTTDSS